MCIIGSGVNGRGSDGAIEGVKGVKELVGGGLIMGEVMQYLILIWDEMS